MVKFPAEKRSREFATFLLTGGVYALAFILALFGNKRRFRRMNIHDMMYLDKQNEQLKNGNRSGKKWVLHVSPGYILFFGWMLYHMNKRHS